MPYTKYHDPWGTGAGGGTPIDAAGLDWIEAGIAAAQTAAEAANVVPEGVGWLWFTNTAPALCILLRGQAISRITYADLFALWSTLYGAGDGSTTFNVPNLEGRIPIGKAASGTAGTLGGTFGTLDHTHTGPSHTHSFDHAHTVSGSTNSPTGEYFAEAQAGGANLTLATHVHAMTFASSQTGAGGTDAAGTGATGAGNPPALVVNFIAYTGV